MVFVCMWLYFFGACVTYVCAAASHQKPDWKDLLIIAAWPITVPIIIVQAWVGK